MPTVTFQNGKSVDFDQMPSPDDIDFVAKQMGIPADGSADTGKSFGQEVSDIATKPWSPGTGNESGTAGVGKVAANLIPSAINTAKTIATSPVDIAKSIGSIPNEFKETEAATGKGFFPTLATALDPRGLIDVAEQMFPAAANTVKGGIDLIRGKHESAQEDIRKAQQSIENDPVGNILPFIVVGREAAYKVSPEAGKTFDLAIQKTAKPAMTVAEPVVNAVKGAAGIPGKLGRFGMSQATGLNPDTISEVANNPGSFSKGAQAATTRQSVAENIKNALDAREESLSETGEGYKSLRKPASLQTFAVDPDFLKNTMSKITGTVIDDTGKVQTSGSASVREAKDVNALQNLYKTWQPVFESGHMTPNEFLNLRTDLAKLSKFDREITKSGDLEAASKIMRSSLNNEYRSRIPGLEDTDATYSSQMSEIQELRKGITNKDGSINMDSLSTKVINATKRNNVGRLAKLEEISPGITQKIKIANAIEDIENTSGHKVGAYSRSLGQAGLVGGIVTGNLAIIAGAIAEMAMANPDFAVPMIRAYGYSKGLVNAVVGKLRQAAHGLNVSTESAPALLSPKPIESRTIPVKSQSTPTSVPIETPRKVTLPVQSLPSDYDFYQKPENMPTIQMGKKPVPAKKRSVGGLRTIR